MKKHYVLLLLPVLSLFFLSGCTDLFDRFRPKDFPKETGTVPFTHIHYVDTEEDVLLSYTQEEVEFLHPYFPFRFPVAHLLAKESPLTLSETREIHISLKDVSFSHETTWPGAIQGLSTAGYEVAYFEVILALEDAPSRLGTGTFRYKADTFGSMKTAVSGEPFSVDVTDTFTMVVEGTLSVKDLKEEGIQWVFSSTSMSLTGSSELLPHPFEIGEPIMFYFMIP